MLTILVGSLVLSGYKAFVQTHIEIDVYYDPELLDAEDASKGNFRAVVQNAIEAQFPGNNEPAELHRVAGILSSGAQFSVRDAVVEDPSLIGETARHRTITINSTGDGRSRHG